MGVGPDLMSNDHEKSKSISHLCDKVVEEEEPTQKLLPAFQLR